MLICEVDLNTDRVIRIGLPLDDFEEDMNPTPFRLKPLVAEIAYICHFWSRFK